MADKKIWEVWEIEEVEGGEYDDYGFYWLPDEAGFYDPDGYFFDGKKGFKDEFGGRYNDDLEYIPAEDKVEELKDAYDQQAEDEIYEAAVKEYDGEVATGTLKSKRTADEAIAFDTPEWDEYVETQKVGPARAYLEALLSSG